MKLKEKTREELLEQLADIRFGIISLTGFYSMLYHPLTLIAIPTGQSYQIIINYGLN